MLLKVRHENQNKEIYFSEVYGGWYFETVCGGAPQ